MRKLYEQREKMSRRGRAVIEEQLSLLRVLHSRNKGQSQMQGTMSMPKWHKFSMMLSSSLENQFFSLTEIGLCLFIDLVFSFKMFTSVKANCFEPASTTRYVYSPPFPNWII